MTKIDEFIGKRIKEIYQEQRIIILVLFRWGGLN